MDNPLWTPGPDRVARANLTRFIQFVNERWDLGATDYHDVYEWSVAKPSEFWIAVWDFCGVRSAHRGSAVIGDPDRMRPGAHYFPDAKANFAENVLRGSGPEPAIVFRNERGDNRIWSHDDLSAQAAGFAGALRDLGIRAGDRVAAYIPNVPEAIAAALGAASVGAVWSSCSPDFGVQGVLDRFGQIEPRVLVAADGYYYGGKTFDSIPKVKEALERLPTVERTIIIPYTREAPPVDALPSSVTWDEFVAPHRGDRPRFEQLPFNHPLYILYSSGTTGIPKCIVHGAGGTLIQHLKEHQLLCDIQRGDRVFYFTTCGWMMWNWLVTVLASEATLLVYDGSPFHPATTLFDFADAAGLTLFGTSAKFIDAAAKAGLRPRETHRLDTLRTITSTGSPLLPESFDYVYTHVKRDVHLASISGGTDIISCFVGGNPLGPVWKGEIQARSLGMSVDVFDDEGRPVRGEKGELVCTKPFPSMPVAFWNDADGRKYQSAYFDRFPGVWTHGDYVELTAHDGVIIFGRSDAVLNPGGVRIGTAEIYRQVEQLPEIVESLVIGQRWDGDERIVLFVKLRDGVVLDDAMRERIRRHVRDNTTPRHVPARIVQVTDIPRTKSGKIVELAVRDVVHSREVKNREALANPEALEQFRDRRELQE